MASQRRFFLRSILLIGSAFFVACGDSGPSGPDPLDAIATVTVSPPQATVDVGSTTQLTATVKNGRGETMNSAVSWASSTPTAATVSTAGLVTGMLEGSSTITASAGGISGTAAVTVNDPFPPQAPSNVVAAPVSNTEIQVTWTDNSANEDDFRIDREEVVPGAGAEDEGPVRVIEEVGSVGPNVTSFQDTGLPPNTEFKYRVRGCNENGCSEPGTDENVVSTFETLGITTATLPGGTVGVAYEQTLTASGGDETYLWSVSVGTLPAGLSLGTGSGVISGMPAAEGGFPFTVLVSSGGQTATVDLSVEVVFVYSCAIQSEIPETECDALEAVYNSTNGPGWTHSADWLATLTPCSWYGVTCGGGSVTKLALDSNGLDGTIPQELGNLAGLKQLTLTSNQLTGGIPSELGSLSDLTDLYLEYNELTGGIPEELAALVKLEELGLAFNQLTGPLHPQFGSLANLETLRVQDNQLSGPLPSELGDLSNLISLSLGKNQWTGAIPAEIGNLQNLKWLQLNSTPISGPIPPEFGALGNLYEAYLNSNNLSGAIPPEIGNMANLGRLYLFGNELTGAIPPELGNLSALENLNLNDNQLTGGIPTQLGNLVNLEKLDLGGNQLTGGIPPELGGLTSLTELTLLRNQLTGTIPPELGNLTELLRLDLFSNQLTGAIPPELGNLASLHTLFLKFNQLSGSIPSEIGNLTNLTGLYLNFNQLTGALPSEIGNLAHLYQMDLHSNQLSGAIPPELGNMGSLMQLTLSENQLSGAIPEELGNLTQLVRLRLYSNQLTGTIPLSVAQLGGGIQKSHNANDCDFLPGNAGLGLLDTQAYRDADLDGDGFICEVPFPPGPAPSLSSIPGSAFFSLTPPASSDPFAPHPWPGVGRDKPLRPD